MQNFTPGTVNRGIAELQARHRESALPVLINREEQKTRNDDQNPQPTLIGKKAGKKIKPGDRLQVRNPDGTLSEEFIFTGS